MQKYSFFLMAKKIQTSNTHSSVGVGGSSASTSGLDRRIQVFFCSRLRALLKKRG